MRQKQGFINLCKILVLLLGIITIVVACDEKKKPNEDLQQAFRLHKKAVKIRQMADDQLDQLKANKDSLFIKAYKKDLEAIVSSLEVWDKQLIEVPGFEHDHAGHDHHHHEQQELTPKQHLEAQQHLLKEIQGIAEKIDEIKKNSNPYKKEQ